MAEQQGISFRFDGFEIISLMESRAKFHAEKAEELNGELKTAEEALAVAIAAGEKAARAAGSARHVRSSGARMTALEAAPSRGYGETMENPVEALDRAITFHIAQGKKLAFYARHIMSSATYILSESDIARYELLVVDGE